MVSIFLFICLIGGKAHVCHNSHVEVRGNLEELTLLKRVIMWVLGIELWFSGLMAMAFIHWALSLTLTATVSKSGWYSSSRYSLPAFLPLPALSFTLCVPLGKPLSTLCLSLATCRTRLHCLSSGLAWGANELVRVKCSHQCLHLIGTTYVSYKLLIAISSRPL